MRLQRIHLVVNGKRALQLDRANRRVSGWLIERPPFLGDCIITFWNC